MKEKRKKPFKKDKVIPKIENQLPNDTLKTIPEGKEEQPQIYKIKKRGKSIGRKDFIKSAASITGLAALGGLLKSCEDPEFDIISKDDACTCHAVCTCNMEEGINSNSVSGDSYESLYDQYQNCTCNTVCTCNIVCSCDTVCSCNMQSSGSGGGGGGGTYWYPN